MRKDNNVVIRFLILLIISLVSIIWFFYVQQREEKQCDSLREEYAYLLEDLIDIAEKDYEQNLISEQNKLQKVEKYVQKIHSISKLNKKELKKEYLDTIVNDIVEDLLRKKDKGEMPREEVIKRIEELQKTVRILGEPDALQYVNLYLRK